VPEIEALATDELARIEAEGIATVERERERERERDR
jgi:formate-dependent phosphoribosylglycinamide formyltransferase (GAR transformylase)